jgi:hypothetical protein
LFWLYIVIRIEKKNVSVLIVKIITKNKSPTATFTGGGLLLHRYTNKREKFGIKIILILSQKRIICLYITKTKSWPAV